MDHSLIYKGQQVACQSYRFRLVGSAFFSLEHSCRAAFYELHSGQGPLRTSRLTRCRLQSHDGSRARPPALIFLVPMPTAEVNLKMETRLYFLLSPVLLCSWDERFLFASRATRG